VLGVLGWGRPLQVLEPVVARDAVLVVDLGLAFFMRQFEADGNDPVVFVGFVLDLDASVAVFVTVGRLDYASRVLVASEGGDLRFDHFRVPLGFFLSSFGRARKAVILFKSYAQIRRQCLAHRDS